MRWFWNRNIHRGILSLLFGTVSTVALEFRMNNAASTPSNMQATVIACSPGGIFDSASRLSFSFRFRYSTTLNGFVLSISSRSIGG
jgi:hypothetical protein